MYRYPRKRDGAGGHFPRKLNCGWMEMTFLEPSVRACVCLTDCHDLFLSHRTRSKCLWRSWQKRERAGELRGPPSMTCKSSLVFSLPCLRPKASSIYVVWYILPLPPISVNIACQFSLGTHEGSQASGKRSSLNSGWGAELNIRKRAISGRGGVGLGLGDEINPRGRTRMPDGRD